MPTSAKPPIWTAEQQRVLMSYQYGITPTMESQLTSYNPEQDPIAAQFIPDARELNIADNELSDPIGDEKHSPVQGLVHRYKNRVLWLMAPTCAVYCRFCFRKAHIGRNGRALSEQDRTMALRYIDDNPQIEEVILSGGDPLNLTCKQLSKYILPLNEIAHIRRLRIHSRIPAVAPQKITADVVSLLKLQQQRVCLVLHINHARELSAAALNTLATLREHGIMLFSQTVLLRGVNDRVETLTELFNNLLDAGVFPYYLHHLDLAQGSSHFRLSLEEGLAIYRKLRTNLAGIALPRYIVEIPAGGGKVAVTDLSEEQRNILLSYGIS